MARRSSIGYAGRMAGMWSVTSGETTFIPRETGVGSASLTTPRMARSRVVCRDVKETMRLAFVSRHRLATPQCRLNRISLHHELFLSPLRWSIRSFSKNSAISSETLFKLYPYRGANQLLANLGRETRMGS